MTAINITKQLVFIPKNVPKRVSHNCYFFLVQPTGARIAYLVQNHDVISKLHVLYVMSDENYHLVPQIALDATESNGNENT